MKEKQHVHPISAARCEFINDVLYICKSLSYDYKISYTCSVLTLESRSTIKMGLELLAPIGLIKHLDHRPSGDPKAERVLETVGIVFWENVRLR